PMTPSSRRRRWCVVSGGYAAFDSAPPANTIVNRPDKIIVGAHPTSCRIAMVRLHNIILSLCAHRFVPRNGPKAIVLRPRTAAMLESTQRKIMRHTTNCGAAVSGQSEKASIAHLALCAFTKVLTRCSAGG
ncbi:hypothetical protein AB3X94_36475, partial [Paraburkholderia sp. BR10923]|uniref:hypothetical protein n=1 Tax=Paraburkholderia sp. BR10923 TaxID=3236992 RepID=UPI0034CEF5B0